MSNRKKFKSFSKKQMAVLTWWCGKSPHKDKNAIICDGAVRSGKTLCMSISFVLWSMSVFDGESFAFCGKTISSLRRNVITP
ncbi:MAG: PBSX family phage terminase large subunit, partial [Oscillospiraceae bacterium]